MVTRTEEPTVQAVRQETEDQATGEQAAEEAFNTAFDAMYGDGGAPTEQPAPVAEATTETTATEATKSRRRAYRRRGH